MAYSQHKVITVPNNLTSKHEPLTVAEYFAGIGLMRLGLERVNWRVVFANDFSPKKFAMYKDAFADKGLHYQVGDIFDLDVQQVPSTFLATSSFPCIDLSLAGKQNGISGKHSSAFWGFIKILKSQLQNNQAPSLVLLENVLGWLSSNKGEDFRLTIHALNELGYACDVFTLDARHFTPQSRPRVFVIGTRHHTPSENHAPFLTRSSALAPKRLKDVVAAHFDLVWRWNEIPPPPPLNINGLEKIIESVAEDDERWWPDEAVTRHCEMMAAAHRRRVIQLVDSDTISYRTIYRRTRNGKQRAEVREGDTAGCLRTAGGGSSRQIVIAVGQNKIRMRFMTSREYARLQGVPDSYPINVDENQALTGFGDAVCVPLITWIADNILAPLADDMVV